MGISVRSRNALLWLLLCGCPGTDDEIQKPATPTAAELRGEVVGPPKPQPVPSEVKICRRLKEEAAKQAGRCNLEILRGCDEKHQARQEGDCPSCDDLDGLNVGLRRAGCI